MTRLVQLSSFTGPRAPWSLWRKEIIPLPPQRVWKALTVEEELARWWCESARVDLRVGGAYEFRGRNVYGGGSSPAPGGEEGEAVSPTSGFRIARLVSNELLEFTWPLLGVETTVTYELTSVIEQTELRVTQTAEEAPGNWPSGGDRPNWWWVALPALRTCLESGKPALQIDYTEAAGEPAARFSADVTTFPWVIWSKLTHARELARWWGRDVTMKLEPQGIFELGLVEEGPSAVLGVEEGRRLVHDWTWSDRTRSTVEWTIEETDTATRVTLTDRGPWPSDAHRYARRIHWASTLLYLKQMSERGVTPRDYQDR